MLLHCDFLDYCDLLDYCLLPTDRAGSLYMAHLVSAYMCPDCATNVAPWCMDYLKSGTLAMTPGEIFFFSKELCYGGTGFLHP